MTSATRALLFSAAGVVATSNAASIDSLQAQAAEARRMSELHSRRAELLDELAEVEEHLFGGTKMKGLLKNGKGECLSCTDQCYQNGGDLHTKTCDESDKAQIWSYKNKNDYSIIKNAKSDKCLDIRQEDMSVLQLWDCQDGNDRQTFKVKGTDSYDLIKDKEVKLCITAKNGVSMTDCDIAEDDEKRRGLWKLIEV
eukprot:TRINITY_DN50744_c0_g1_i1.p1 TRINITY_DN50744_c0_g1~~TRINITY_DN50744_c0_g1_i1.p1  ORF type:complete len:197 (-),score=62.00 TRINITY_DN50744_c0_g1_i1:118-708(-)